MAGKPLEDIPELEGWMTLPDAARELGITRSRVHQIQDSGQFESTRRIGGIKIVRTVEVEQRKARIREETESKDRGESQ